MIRRTARTALSAAVLIGAGYLAKQPTGHCRSCGTCICTRCQTRRARTATTGGAR